MTVSSSHDSADVSISGNLEASNGSVVIARAADGTAITVNNWSVPESMVQQHASHLKLAKEYREQVTRDFLQDIEIYYRHLPLKGMGDNSGLRLHFPQRPNGVAFIADRSSLTICSTSLPFDTAGFDLDYFA